MGASGSGKDSVLRYFREHFTQKTETPIIVAHRYITRTNDSTENAISLTDTEFQLRFQHELFSLNWQAHELHYGIGLEVNAWLAKGVSVLVNGSRAYLSEAKEKYPNQLHSILIDTDQARLAERLKKRQRESIESVERRLQRNQQLQTIWPDSTVDNNHSIESAAKQLFAIINGTSEQCISNF